MAAGMFSRSRGLRGNAHLFWGGTLNNAACAANHGADDVSDIYYIKATICRPVNDDDTLPSNSIKELR